LIALTAIVLTQDEAGNISPCLRALAPAEDVIVVDSGSTDDTLALAKAARPGVRTFQHPFLDFGDQRNWALDNCQPRHEWILFVDADEYCDPELLVEIDGFIREPGSFVGGFIAGRNYFLGRWLKRCTMYPSYQLRLLKLGHVRYEKMGHGQREVTDGPLHYFRNGWRHESFSKGVEHWIERHNRYSSAEVTRVLRLRSEPIEWGNLVARDAIARRRALKQLSVRLPAGFAFRFVYLYLVRGGFLEGYPGLLYCLLMATHSINIQVKLAEARLAELRK